MDREDTIQQIVELMAKCQRPAGITDWHKLGLSHAQMGMLYTLSYHKRLQAKQTAEYLGISKSAASQLIDPLVAQQLVDRQADDHDRRIAYLSLTSRGNRRLKEFRRLKMAGVRLHLEALNDKELKQLASLYRKMASGQKGKI